MIKNLLGNCNWLNIKRNSCRIFFWLLIWYTAISTTLMWSVQLGFIGGGGQQGWTEQFNEYQPLAVFSQKFAREYFFWTKGHERARAHRLLKFWKHGCEPNEAALSYSTQKNSYVRHADILSIERDKSDPRLCKVTVVVEALQVNPDNEQDQERVEHRLEFLVEMIKGSYKVAGIPELGASIS